MPRQDICATAAEGARRVNEITRLQRQGWAAHDTGEYGRVDNPDCHNTGLGSRSDNGHDQKGEKNGWKCQQHIYQAHDDAVYLMAELCRGQAKDSSRERCKGN